MPSRDVSPGSIPGTFTVPDDGSEPSVRVFRFSPDRFDERTLTAIGSKEELCADWPVTWVDVDEVGSQEILEQLRDAMNLHPLALEDVVHDVQRPKVEQYGDHLFIVVQMASLQNGRVFTEQLSIFLGDRFVVTFQGNVPGDSLEPVRERIRRGTGRVRGEGADYLAYAIIDACIDQYFPVLEATGDRIDKLEDDIIQDLPDEAPELIQDLKHDVLALRRTLWPLRDAVNTLQRDEVPPIRASTRVYLRDCYDHATRLLDTIDSHRDVSGGLMDVYLSISTHRMNDVMKFLTLIATIFIPLTFITGLYGMNFDVNSRWNMPELSWPYGYFFALGLMALTALSLTAYFWWRGWLRRPTDR